MKKQDIRELLQEVIEKLQNIKDELAGDCEAVEVALPEIPDKYDEDHPFDPDRYEFIDLGLKSGRRWATRPAPGHYQYDEAVEVFGDYLPRASAMVELREDCDWKWDDEEKGYNVTGPNGNTIFIPANGWQDFDVDTEKLIPGALNNVGSGGNWWTFAPNSQTYARNLYFNSGSVNPLSINNRANGYGVWPCRELS